MEAAQMPVFIGEYVEEVERGLPEGEGATASELRVDYLLQKIAEQEAHVLRIAEFTARRIQMVKEHGEREMESHRKRIAWLTTQVKLHVPPSGQSMQKVYGRKSLPLPHGTVGYRSTGETLAIVDPAKALQFAKDNGLEITVKESVGKTPLHEYVSSTGEVPDPAVCGFEVHPARETWFITSKGGEI